MVRSKGKTLKQDLSSTPSFFYAQLYSFIPIPLPPLFPKECRTMANEGSCVHNSSLYTPSCLFFSMLHCGSFPWSAVSLRRNWILNRLQFLQGISIFLGIGSSSGFRICSSLVSHRLQGNICPTSAVPPLPFSLTLLLAGLVLTLFSSVLNFLWCSCPFLNIFSQGLCSMLS